MSRRYLHLSVLLGAVVVVAIAFVGDAYADRNSSGTYSLPSGNPVVSGNTISSSWANTTLSDIATELTNSLDRTGQGCMTGQFQSANGTSSAPGISFCNDVSSGFWRAGDDDIRFGVDSAENIQFLKSYNQMRVTLVTDGGINAQQGYAGRNGIDARGNTTGSGVSATGGATGVGVTGTGGGTSGYGGSFTGGGTTAGLYADNGTDSTAASPRQAIKSDGTIALDGANPNPDAGFTDTLTPTNLVKAWARMTSGSADPQISAGFNVTTATCAGTDITLNFANAMGSTAYLPILSWSNADVTMNWSVVNASSMTINAVTANDGSAIDLCGSAMQVGVLVMGAQ